MNQADLDERGIIISCPNCERRNRLAYATLNQQTQCAACKTPLPHPASPLEVSHSSRFSPLIANSSLPVLVDFWAAWCGPCKMMAPELDLVAGAASGKLLVLKVNTDSLPELAQQYQVSSLPTLTLFSQGRELGRVSGALPSAGIQQFVRSHIE